MNSPVLDQAIARMEAGETEGLVVASTDILTVGEVVRIIEAGGLVAFAEEDLVLSGTVRRGSE